jgi:hypothetical protein
MIKIIKNICLVILLVVIGSCNLPSLKEKGVLTTGKITDELHSSSSGVFLRYEYSVEGEKYIGSSETIYFCYGLFVGKVFPVIYHKEHPNISAILVDPRDFENFNVEFPDSLVWVYDCFKKFR